MLKKVEPIVFALKPWTIKEDAGKYYVSLTTYYDQKRTWSKPYPTLRRAITAVARHLEREWSERRARSQR